MLALGAAPKKPGDAENRATSDVCLSFHAFRLPDFYALALGGLLFTDVVILHPPLFAAIEIVRQNKHCSSANIQTWVGLMPCSLFRIILNKD